VGSSNARKRRKREGAREGLEKRTINEPKKRLRERGEENKGQEKGGTKRQCVFKDETESGGARRSGKERPREK